jgi:hypothetical protein
MYLAAHCAPQDGGYVTAHCIASHYVRSLGLTGEQGQLIAQITSALEAHEFFRSGSWCPDGATDESLHRLEASRLRLMLPGLGRDEACRPPLGRCWTCGSAQFKYGAGFAGYRHAGHKRCASHCMCRTGGLSFVRKLT